MNSFIDIDKDIPVLGIIGGMGPLVDGELISLIHRHTVSSDDRGHIPIILDGNCVRPDRSEYIRGGGKSPLPSILDSLSRLESMGASVIAMPCNTAHVFSENISSSAKAGVKIIDMTDKVCENCKKRGFRSVTLLATEGTYRSEIYIKKLRKLGIACVIPKKSDINRLGNEIRLIKSGDLRSVSDIIEKALRVSDGVITGCTELSISVINDRSLNRSELKDRISDSLSVLAASCIEACEKPRIPILFT